MKEGIFTLNSHPISFGEIEKKGEKNFFIEGFISTSDKDLVNDVVTERALNSMIEQLKSRVIKLDFEHEAFRGESEIEMEVNKTKVPLGKASDFTRVKDTEKNGILVRWDVNPTWKKFDEKGNVVMDFNEIKFNVENGFYDAFSIAFIPTKDATIVRDGGKVRLLDDLNLLNVALTGNPINPRASVTEVFMKSLDYLEKNNSSQNKIKREVKMSEEEKKDETSEESESESTEEPAKEESTDKPSESSGESKEESDSEAKKESDGSQEESSEPSEAEKKAEKARVEVKNRLDKIEERLDSIEKSISKPIQKAKSEQAPTQKESLETQQKEIADANPLDQI